MVCLYCIITIEPIELAHTLNPQIPGVSKEGEEGKSNLRRRETKK